MKIEVSPKQCEFINKANHRWNGKIGATQCGKTFIDVAYVIPSRIRERQGKPGLFLILGVTKETIERNVLEPMRDFWGAQLIGEINSRNIAKLFGEKVYCLGAEKITQVTKLRGAKIKYAYCDELVDLNEQVFELLKSRLSLSYSVCDFTGNPSHPNHYVKKFIESDADIYSQKWTIDDNPFLDPVRVEELKREYAGTVYYNRYILGEWTLAEGLIYQHFASNNKDYIADDIPKVFTKILIGVDWGDNGSAHSFTATGIVGKFQSIIVLSSERHNAKGLTPTDVENKVVAFIEKIINKYGKVDMIFCDHIHTFINGCRVALANSGVKTLITGANKCEITERILVTSKLMALGKLYLSRDCKSLQEAFNSAVWDSKHADKRLDDGTTDIDSLDSFEYSWSTYINMFSHS